MKFLQILVEDHVTNKCKKTGSDLLSNCHFIEVWTGKKLILSSKNCLICVVFTPQPLGAVGVLFTPMVSRWAGGQAGGLAAGKVCLACISEAISCRKLILGMDIG